MVRLLFIFLIAQTAFSQETDYIPFLSEIAAIDSSFRFQKSNDTIYLNYGIHGHRVELVNNRLSTITPISAEGEINGYRTTYKFSKKVYRWPENNTDLYRHDTVMSENCFKPKRLKGRDIELINPDSVELMNLPKLFRRNDSLNHAIQGWVIDEIDTPHQLRLYGRLNKDSSAAFISFRNGFFHIIGIESIQNSTRIQTLYLFDFGKPVFKISIVNGKICGPQSFFWNNKIFDFNCGTDQYDCFCELETIPDDALKQMDAEYFYLSETEKGIRLHFSNYTYYTLLKFQK